MIMVMRSIGQILGEQPYEVEKTPACEGRALRHQTPNEPGPCQRTQQYIINGKKLCSAHAQAISLRILMDEGRAIKIKKLRPEAEKTG